MKMRELVVVHKTRISQSLHSAARLLGKPIKTKNNEVVFDFPQ